MGRRAAKKGKAKAKQVTEKNDDGKTSLIIGSREDPPQILADQYIFLLQLFVLRITGKRLAKLNQMFFVPTTVCFKFLDFEADEDTEITPVDPLFQPQAGIADDTEEFYSGRAVMFAVDLDSVTKKSTDFILSFCVKKKMPEGIKPDVLVGNGTIDLSMQFAALRKELLQCWHRNIPPLKSYSGQVELLYDDCTVGSMKVVTLLSAFGQTVVTEFDAPPEERPPHTYVFKGDELNEKALAYSCRIVDPEDPLLCGAKPEDPKPPCPRCIPDRHFCVPCGCYEGADLKLQCCKDCPPSPPECPSVSACASVTSKPSNVNVSSCPDPCCPPKPCCPSKPCCPIQTSRGPAMPCGKAVVLKVSGLLDTGEDCKRKQPTVTVAPACDAIGPNSPPDPEHDIFVLRIGKKGLVGPGEKSDIQLEMRTPKGPERRPPIRYETRDMQTDVEKKKEKKAGKKKKK